MNNIWKEILDDWVKTAVSKTPEAAKTVKATIEATIDQFGGVQGFVKMAVENEWSKKVKTWANDGKNFVKEHEKVQQLLGNEKVQAIARRLQTTPEKLTTLLAQVLPPMLERIEKIKSMIPQDGIIGKAIGTAQSLAGGVFAKFASSFGPKSSQQASHEPKETGADTDKKHE